ncbi:hypothetical protein Nepgr_006191 [Nepenthes gracilis]|uniref:BHLH domain-containing protein n=1 Tax=Nepenthes gracilis TaxID=150966 RepID=A0AAD3S568_NEPGR|nr:hypothetical protein Nepgr_006191 [Nepenthes gracilis]
MLEGSTSSIVQFPNLSSSLYGFDEYHHEEQLGLQEDHLLPASHSNSNATDKIISNQVIALSDSPPLSSSSSNANSTNGSAFHVSSYQPGEVDHHALMNFKSFTYGSCFMHSSGSLLSFQQACNRRTCHSNEYHMWEGSRITSGSPHESQLTLKNSSCNSYQDAANEWFYAEAAAMADSRQTSGTQQTNFNKRPLEESTQAPKKHCTSGSRKAKPKSMFSKDPQSIAAKNQRERISERLKILQDLVPNGSKVDLVTMLEKAIGYVKFLQLQVKVLATDEFWPAARGKTPDISQVREAMDAILSSQRATTTSSSKKSYISQQQQQQQKSKLEIS